MQLVLRAHRRWLVEIEIRCDADGETEVEPGTVLLPATHWDGIQTEENIGGDSLNILWTADQGSAGGELSIGDKLIV